MYKPLIFTLVFTMFSAPFIVSAQEEKSDGKDGIAFSVDGTSISDSMLDYYGKVRQQRAPNAPDLSRDQLINEFLSTILLANAYDSLNLAENGSNEIRYEMMINKAKAVVQEYIKVTEKEVESMYDELYKSKSIESVTTMEYNTRHILVDAAEKELALEIIEKLDDGEDFAELAAEHSKDVGSGSRGGDLGWYGTSDLVRPYSEAMQSLEVGEITEEPVESQFGWHIIQLVEEPRKASVPTLAEATPKLRNKIYSNKVQAYIEKLRIASEIVTE